MGPPPVLSVEAPETLELPAGKEVVAEIAVQVAAGYHVQANPASSEFLVPLDLAFEETEGISIKAPIYPPGQPYLLEGSEEALSTYKGQFALRVPLATIPAMPPGTQLIKGTLHYQACDARTCLFPASVPVLLQLQILAPHPTLVE